MKEIFSIQNILMYLAVINLIGFFVMFLDKKKAKRGSWRISENAIFIITAIGGGIGTIAGMYRFRHKTKKARFKYGLPFLLICDIAILVCLWINIK
ncbi:MAG: DUF1294 domain-containing protein [Clostridia bacterium]|nr:DUF1294 domain-containing protein [Clostridia bacterium]